MILPKKPLLLPGTKKTTFKMAAAVRRCQGVPQPADGAGCWTRFSVVYTGRGEGKLINIDNCYKDAQGCDFERINLSQSWGTNVTPLQKSNKFFLTGQTSLVGIAKKLFPKKNKSLLTLTKI